MKIRPSLLTLVLLFCSFAFYYSCNSKNDLQEKEKVLFYYPQKNAYYDSQRAYYYYSLNAAKTWDSLPFKGEGFGKALGQAIAIEKTAEDPWLNNDSHRLKYNGILLNLVNENTILLARADSIKKIKPAIANRTKTLVVKEVEPPKKGLKKFFNRIFGKKRKPVEEKKQ